eukprot:3477200-Amphidinium_carterae.1
MCGLLAQGSEQQSRFWSWELDHLLMCVIGVDRILLACAFKQDGVHKIREWKNPGLQKPWNEDFLKFVHFLTLFLIVLGYFGGVWIFRGLPIPFPFLKNLGTRNGAWRSTFDVGTPQRNSRDDFQPCPIYRKYIQTTDQPSVPNAMKRMVGSLQT